MRRFEAEEPRPSSLNPLPLAAAEIINVVAGGLPLSAERATHPKGLDSLSLTATDRLARSHGVMSSGARSDDSVGGPAKLSEARTASAQACLLGQRIELSHGRAAPDGRGRGQWPCDHRWTALATYPTVKV